MQNTPVQNTPSLWINLLQIHNCYDKMINMNMNELTSDEIARLYELYMLECEQTNTRPDLSDFALWWSENYE